MSMNGPLARAARALIQWPRSHVAKIAELDEETLAVNGGVKTGHGAEQKSATLARA